mmetsp:Transcript_38200/g.118031  ORF Transcript_38200/g.118031 Transcript_38200/m.118031 type:complete len:389 (+) Transcript_38200:2518-3684(+)
MRRPVGCHVSGAVLRPNAAGAVQGRFDGRGRTHRRRWRWAGSRGYGPVAGIRTADFLPGPTKARLACPQAQLARVCAVGCRFGTAGTAGTALHRRCCGRLCRGAVGSHGGRALHHDGRGAVGRQGAHAASHDGFRGRHPRSYAKRPRVASPSALSSFEHTAVLTADPGPRVSCRCAGGFRGGGFRGGGGGGGGGYGHGFPMYHAPVHHHHHHHHHGHPDHGGFGGHHVQHPPLEVGVGFATHANSREQNANANNASFGVLRNGAAGAARGGSPATAGGGTPPAAGGAPPKPKKKSKAQKKAEAAAALAAAAAAGTEGGGTGLSQPTGSPAPTAATAAVATEESKPRRGSGGNSMRPPAPQPQQPVADAKPSPTGSPPGGKYVPPHARN